MTPLAELASQCAANEVLFERLVAGVLSQSTRRKLEAHLASCPTCRRQWEWVRWSNQVLRWMIDTKAETAVDQVRADALARTHGKLVRALDQVGKRLLIDCGGGKHRIVLGRPHPLKASVIDVGLHIRTLDRIESGAVPERVAAVMRRLLKHRLGAPRTITLADDVLTLACELDSDYPQPILRRIQLPACERSLAFVERGVELILALSEDPLLRSVALLELASSQIKCTRDLALAADTLDCARKQDKNRGEVIGNFEIAAFLAGRTSQSSFGRHVATAFRATLRSLDEKQRRSVLRVLNASLAWLRSEHLVEAHDQRFMSTVLARVLS